ncbi:MAG: type II toxin-antitoxin system RelE/ParE family toxin [Armatimonadota bacterium]
MKKLFWMGSSLDDLREFPEDVKDVIGYALRFAQDGGKHPDAKPLKGYKGAGILEIVDDFDGDTYRCVYTIRFEDAVYVLHAFQKKSKHGISTPIKDKKIVDDRLKSVEELHKKSH